MVDHSGWVLISVYRMSYCVCRTETKNEIRDTRYERRIEGGDVAQLGERRPRTAEVSGSIPLISTNFLAYSVQRLAYSV